MPMPIPTNKAIESHVQKALQTYNRIIPMAMNIPPTIIAL